MKKLILLMCLLSGILSSCKKDEAKKQDDTEKKTLLNIQITDFKTTIDNLPSGAKKQASARTISGDSMKLYFHYLHYRIYDEDDNGALVLSGSQRYTDENFGQLRFPLSEHNYTIALFAFKDSANVQTTNAGANMNLPGTDAFYARTVTHVSGDSLNLDMTLERIVGKLKVIIQDQVPRITRTITITPTIYPDPGTWYYNIRNYIDFRTGLVDETGVENPILNFPYTLPHTITYPGLTLECYFFANTERNFIITVVADRNERPFAQAGPIGPVPIRRNRTSVLTGAMFDVNNDNGLNVTLEEPAEWTDETQINF